MRISRRFTVFIGLACMLSAESAGAAISGLQRVASGMAAPIFVTHAPGDTSRLFIAQRGGFIRILDLNTGVLQTPPFLSMSGIDASGEGGFLGLAFHPNYFNAGMQGFGKFYVNVTTTGAPLTTRIREFQVSATNPNLANVGSLREILSFAQPQANHNGGWIGFSPQNDYLYIASGDGGGSNDSGTGHTPPSMTFTGGNAQDITNNLLGKMLRIDVNGDDFPADGARNYAIPPSNPFIGVTGDDEIWSYGLRNPFRASFDRLTGDLWIGDVGQDNREEIDFQPAHNAGGANYGWRLREGNIATPTGGVGGTCAGCINPVYSYTHPDSTVGPLSPAGYDGNVVTGGYVYRGPDLSLRGKYFFLDSRSSAPTSDDNYWMFDPANPHGTVMNIDSLLTPNTGTAQFPVSFGEDANGNLYIAYIVSGEVYRIVTDSNVTGDYDGDGDVDAQDYNRWRSSFGQTARPGSLRVDGNRNGIVDAADYVVWRKAFGAGGSAGAASFENVPEPAGAVFVAPVLGMVLLRVRRWETM